VTDASLLTITGFPAFAVGDESLCQQAKDMVVEKLEVKRKLGKYSSSTNAVVVAEAFVVAVAEAEAVATEAAEETVACRQQE